MSNTATISESIIDIADCHTTLYYFEDPAPAAGCLGLGSSAGYTGLYTTLVANPGSTPYQTLCSAPGQILHKLSPGYRNNKYWNRRLKTTQYNHYYKWAWLNLIPVECRITHRVEAVLKPSSNLKVSPVPRVMLYPFGWSAWLSLRVTGTYEIGELATFLAEIFDQKVFKVTDQNGKLLATVNIRGLFEHIADGVRADAFATDALDMEPGSLVEVITVLSKWGGTLPVGQLASYPAISRMIKPEGPALTNPLTDYVFQPDPANSHRYLIMRDDLRFIWIEPLLLPQDRNYEHLRCYHNNNFHSLLHARHLLELLTAIQSVVDPLPPAITGLKRSALSFFKAPGYQNAGLRKFQEHPAVVEMLKPPPAEKTP